VWRPGAVNRVIRFGPPNMSAASPKREIAAVFERLAADTGDAAWLRAALALTRPKQKGRQSIDDSAALDEMAWLRENGKARSVEQAAGLVAATLTGEHSVTSARDRLARKYRNKISDKIGSN
jgi:hypothetical protein